MNGCREAIASQCSSLFFFSVISGSITITLAIDWQANEKTNKQEKEEKKVVLAEASTTNELITETKS